MTDEQVSPKTVVEVCAKALKEHGIEFDAAVILLRVPTGMTVQDQPVHAILGGTHGDAAVCGILMASTMAELFNKLEGLRTTSTMTPTH